MNANEILLRLKSVFTDTALPAVRSFVAAVGKQMKNAGTAIAGVSAMFGEIPGKIGKIVGGLGRLSTAFLTLGPIGASVAVISTAFEWLQGKAQKAADAIMDAAKSMADAISARCEKIRASIRDALQASLEESTVKAQRAIRAFNTLADAYMKVAKAKDATAKAGDDAEIAALRQQRAEAVEAKGDSPDAAIVGAQFDVKIAERAAKATADAHDRAVKAADKDAKDANDRLVLMRDAEAKAEKALAEAQQREAHAREDITPNDGGEWERQMRQAREKAEAAVFAAQQARISAEADATAADEKLKQAQLAQSAALSNSTAALASARTSLKNLVAARKKATQAELEEAERKALAEAEKARAQQARDWAAAREKELKDDHKKLVKNLDDAIAAARQAAQAWEQTAQQTRDFTRNNGGGFAAWNAQQRDEARARERGNRKEANALANAEKEIGRLENEERRWGRNMNPAQRERLNNLRNFRDQLIGRNDAAKEAERLQKRKDEAVINTEKRLNEIRDWLKVNGGL